MDKRFCERRDLAAAEQRAGANRRRIDHHQFRRELERQPELAVEDEQPTVGEDGHIARVIAARRQIAEREAGTGMFGRVTGEANRRPALAMRHEGRKCPDIHHYCSLFAGY